MKDFKSLKTHPVNILQELKDLTQEEKTSRQIVEGVDASIKMLEAFEQSTSRVFISLGEKELGIINHLYNDLAQTIGNDDKYTNSVASFVLYISDLLGLDDED